MVESAKVGQKMRAALSAAAELQTSSRTGQQQCASEERPFARHTIRRGRELAGESAGALQAKKRQH